MAKRVLFTCFNCKTCDLPFDAQHGGAHTPYVGSFDGKLLVACQTASFDDPLHSEIQRGIMTLMVAGGGKLADVTKQQYFADGTRITDEMERLLEDFSNECEIYMPVARKFNDRIMDFKVEQLGVRGSQIDVRPSVEAAAAKEHPQPKKVVEAVAAQEPAAGQAAPAAAAVPSAGQ
ncbi:unnamed protein product, partial [Mesorhabditis spiculigera]